MGFVFGVLIIGALLSVIFGKHIGALFVLGTGTIVAICFGVLLILLAPLIWWYWFPPSHPQVANTSYSYSQPSYQAQSSNQGQTPYQAQTAPQAQPQEVAGLSPSEVDDMMDRESREIWLVPNYRCPTDLQGRQALATWFTRKAAMFRRQAPYGDPMRAGFFAEDSKDCDVAAAKLLNPNFDTSRITSLTQLQD